MADDIGESERVLFFRQVGYHKGADSQRIDITQRHPDGSWVQFTGFDT